MLLKYLVLFSLVNRLSTLMFCFDKGRIVLMNIALKKTEKLELGFYLGLCTLVSYVVENLLFDKDVRN